MPLIKPRAHRVQVVRHIVRLQEPHRDALVAYARFISESPDYVLNQLIDLTLLKDKDFIAWREQEGTGAATATDPAPNPPSIGRRGAESSR